MAYEMKQSLKMTQSLVMTPQLQQAIKLLQLSRLELENMITKEMMENPVLEESQDLQEKDREGSAEESDRAKEAPQEKIVEGEDSFDWQSYVESYNPSMPQSTVRPADDVTPFENVTSKTKDLHEHLVWQIQMTKRLEGDLENIAMMLIGNINDDGYLKISLEEIIAKEGWSLDQCEKALKVIQSFDPVGVGARDLKECLLAQAMQLDPRDEFLEKLIQENLHHLEKKNYSAISKSMNLSMDKVIELSKVVLNMEPKPGRSFSSTDTHYITPDVFVTKINGKYEITLNEEGLPRLRISNFYKNILKGKTTGSLTKEYIQEKLRSAVWLIRSIHQRQRTIYKVTESIVKYQLAFLDKGSEHLKPMVLRDVAQDIGMHESTVSRVTTNKYVHTQQGIYELKYFFNSSIGKGGDVEMAS